MVMSVKGTTTIVASKDIPFPDFDDIPVSTRTFIVMTNLTINLQKLFDILPVTELAELPAKTTMKRGAPNPFAHLEPGSILTLKYKNRIRGVELKSRRSQKKKEPRWFRNSFTVVMVLRDKPINFKVYSDGILQLTGCKVDAHPEQCVQFLWRTIKPHLCEDSVEDLMKPETEGVYKFSRGEKLEALFIPAMRNVDFGMGFIVNREKLAFLVNTRSPYHALLETSSGYIGVNIKIPLDKPIESMPIVKLGENSDGTWEYSMTVYAEYLKHLSTEERTKKLGKERFTTLLVFHSGRVILSSVTEEYSRDAYFKFVSLISDNFSFIEEKLE